MKARTWSGWLLYLRRDGGAWDADGQACVYLSRTEAEAHRESPYEELVRVQIVEQRTATKARDAKRAVSTVGAQRKKPTRKSV